MPGVAHNALVITAHWVEQGALRHTPAGLPAVDLLLEHQGLTQEAGIARRVDLKLKAVALGDVARQAQALKAETTAHFSGFLAPTRNGKGLVMHITRIETAV